MAKIHQDRNKISVAIADICMRAMPNASYKHKSPYIHQAMLCYYQKHSPQQKTDNIPTKTMIADLAIMASSIAAS